MRLTWSFSSTATAILVASGASIGVVRSSIVQHWLARSDGFVVVVDRPNRILSAKVGETIPIDFKLTNVTSEAAEIVGIRTGCGCTSAEPIPCMIAGHSTETVRLTIDMENRKSGEVFELWPEVYLNRSTRKVGMSIRVTLTP